MSLWVQIVLSGPAAGSVYGVIGIGHTLVHRLTGIVQFALGLIVALVLTTAISSDGDQGRSALLIALVVVGGLAALGGLTVLWAHM